VHLKITASCRHCGQQVVVRAAAIAEREIGLMRDHLLGCPATLAACAPALPIFERTDDVLQHVDVEQRDG